jgi:uncharacterized membrane protein
MYLALLMAVIWWITRKNQITNSLKHVVFIAVGITVGGVLLYLPWYPSFASQAGGVLPNVIFPTKFRQFVVMFGTSFIPILVWLIFKLRSDWKNVRVNWLILLGFGIPIGLLMINLLLTALAAGVLQSQEPVDLQSTLSGLGASSVSEVFNALVDRRLKYSWTALVLGFMLSASGVLLWRGVGKKHSKKDEVLEISPFVLMIIVIGGLLILGPEFLYLKDQFGTRMNTIFKFYFTAWILWGLAAAYVSFELWPKKISLVGTLRLLIFVPLIMGLFYPMMSLWTKTNGFNPSGGRTLDGTEFLARIQPADYSAISWINDELPEGVISEAVGGSYTYAGRVSTHTGLDTVLGWPGHESQWRGGATEQGSRGGDLQRLYQTRDWVEAKSIMDSYQIDYVFIGDLERSSYNPIDERKFRVFMDVIYENESVQIFARSDEAIP